MSANEFYDSTGSPSSGSSLNSSSIRAEFDAIEDGFNKMPTLLGNNNKLIGVNPGGSGLETKENAAVLSAIGGEGAANKDASGGYPGLTLFKINFKNALGTVISFLANSNTGARTYTFQDRNGTIADNTDLALKANVADLALKADASALALKANIASPTFTGTPSAPTPAATDNSTKIATTAHVKNSMPGLVGSNGYQKLPNGIVLQWGVDTYPGGSVSRKVTFPLAFTFGPFAFLPVPSDGKVQVTTWDSTSFTYNGGVYGQYTFWMAVGFITPA